MWDLESKELVESQSLSLQPVNADFLSADDAWFTGMQQVLASSLCPLNAIALACTSGSHIACSSLHLPSSLLLLHKLYSYVGVLLFISRQL